MSNLNLPRMTYTTLRGMTDNSIARGNEFGYVKLAYETTAEKVWGKDTIVIRHHGNPIAEIGPDFFTLDNAGWHSRTTSDRLNRILQDNQTALPTDPNVTDRLYYSVRIQQGRMVVTGRDVAGKSRILREFDRSVAHFSRVDSYAHFALEGGDEYR